MIVSDVAKADSRRTFPATATAECSFRPSPDDVPGTAPGTGSSEPKADTVADRRAGDPVSMTGSDRGALSSGPAAATVGLAAVPAARAARAATATN